MLSLGFLFFFFIGRFLFFAFAVAAVFGLVFMTGRRALYGSRRRPHKPIWKNDLLMEYPGSLQEENRPQRVIIVE